jgi:hypothetical protein
MSHRVPTCYGDIIQLSDVADILDRNLLFISDQVLYVACSSPRCKAVHVLMKKNNGPYECAATFSVEMCENLLLHAILIEEFKHRQVN